MVREKRATGVPEDGVRGLGEGSGVEDEAEGSSHAEEDRPVDPRLEA